MLRNILKTYFLLIATGLMLNAQPQFLFQRLTSEDGLSQNSVFAIQQDKFGFMWFGTRDGLNKFDGYKMINFHNEPYNNNSLAGNLIRDIIEDDIGNLYIRTQSGLSKYIINLEKFETIKFYGDSTKNAPRIFTLYKGKENVLWIGTDNGVFKFNPETNLSETILRDENIQSIHQIYEDSDGNLWVAGNYKIFKYVRKTGRLQSFAIQIKKAGDLITGPMREGPDGLIWIGSLNGIYIAEKSSNKIMPVQHYYPWITEDTFSAIKTIAFEGNNVWLGGLSCGLHKINLEDHEVESYASSLNDRQNPGSTNIVSLYVDNSNAIWIGTNGAGVLYHNPTKNNLKLISNRNYDIVNQSMRAIYKDHQNDLWIGGYRGLDKLNRESGDCMHYSGRAPGAVLSGITVCSIAEDPENKNTLWLGFENGGFDLFYKKTGRCLNVLKNQKELEFLETASINKFIFDENNNVWISSNRGLLKLDRRFKILKHYHPDSKENKISDELVQSIYKDLDGNIWAVTALGGVNKINIVNNTVKVYKNKPSDINSLISNFVYSCTRDGYGYMWFGTDSGLERFDPEKEEFVHYSMKDGLPNNNIYGILIDGQSNLWLSTNNGISKYDQKNKSFYNFNSGHNLQDREFNSYAYHKAFDGELFFGGLKGINSIYSNEIESISDYPVIQLTDFKVFNESVYPGKLFDGQVILKKTITNTDELVLDYNQNTISLEFSALNYFDNESIKYSYLLDKYDTDWHETGTRRYASYANLPPGNYTFKVKSTNVEGLWNTEYLQLPIIVNPPLWRSWYAYFTYSLITTSLIVGLFIGYRNKSRRADQELQRQKEIAEKLIKVDKLKDNFLAQVSHEIRTPINSILSFTSLIESEFKDKLDDDLKFGLDSIDSSSRRIIRTIDLLLNFSEVQSGMYIAKKTIQDLYLDILKPVFAEHKLFANNKGLDLKLTNTSKHYLIKGDNYSVTQIFANLVENAIKYTEAGSIEIMPYEKGNMICVDVSDTGIGISKEFLPDLFNPFRQETEGYTRRFEGNGLGLALVKKYCELNFGNISVASEKGKGTTFTVEFPRA